jgi:hypothetical protein
MFSLESRLDICRDRRHTPRRVSISTGGEKGKGKERKGKRGLKKRKKKSHITICRHLDSQAEILRTTGL